jgi:DNA modification methylase
MKTNHRVIVSDSRAMREMDDESIDLVITSPPYPMIQMWDGMFSSLSPAVRGCLENGDGNGAFEAMHIELDKVWGEVRRVLKPGTFACINIGDATRTIGDRFRLYSNHSRITNAFHALGFDVLPVIFWRKQTNAPTKFMGSGMLAAGAYVKLEHEYILIFRKGTKRQFKTAAQKSSRMRSAFFWEERNKWFSDVWDFKGTTQEFRQGDLRVRSGAYPLELAYRLVNMYSLYEETVLDPFLGTGTTTFAAIACGRNSVGYEIDKGFSSFVTRQAAASLQATNDLLSRRIREHSEFITSRSASKGPPKYSNRAHGFSVMTGQETGLQLYRVTRIEPSSGLTIAASYEPLGKLDTAKAIRREQRGNRKARPRQLTLKFRSSRSASGGKRVRSTGAADKSGATEQ